MLVEIDKSFKGLDLKDSDSTHSLKEQLANLAFLTKAQYELGEVKGQSVMALLQISEPDGPELAGTKELKAVIGIDLGTTNSLVGYVDEQDTAVKICLDDNGHALIKSVSDISKRSYS